LKSYGYSCIIREDIKMALLAFIASTVLAAERGEYCMVSVVDNFFNDGISATIDCEGVSGGLSGYDFASTADVINQLTRAGWTLVSVSSVVTKGPWVLWIFRSSDIRSGDRMVFYRPIAAPKSSSKPGEPITYTGEQAILAEKIVNQAYAIIQRKRGDEFNSDVGAVIEFLKSGRSENDAYTVVKECVAKLPPAQSVASCFSVE
jgi:hypothetical protein